MEAGAVGFHRTLGLWLVIDAISIALSLLRNRGVANMPSIF